MARELGSHSWSAEEERIVRANAGMMSYESIAELLPGRSAMAVQLFIYRRRIPVRRTVARPIIQIMLRTKFGDETLFTPNKDFYRKAKIGSRRFQDLSRGYAQPTQEEIIRISRALSMKPDEMLAMQEATQLDLFEDLSVQDKQ
ncbi:MAG: SANT/Myb domain-containing protein [Bacteroidaceae bacterium]|nr:SANT/Myb domain-containing protein [Bacteroidaceae bacterium]